MQKSQLDLGTRQGTSVMKAMQNLTLFLGEETPTEKTSTSPLPTLELKVPAGRLASTRTTDVC